MLLKKTIKKINRLSYACYFRYVVFSCCVFTSGKVYGQAQNTYFIEAEDFQFPAGWVFSKETGTNVSGKGALFAAASKDPVPDAMTVISLKTKGSFFVWTRSRDYAENQPGTRKYLLSVNEQEMSLESGRHLSEGYAWEKVGRIDLDTGENVLSLKNTSGNFVRCDAIVLSTDEAFNPGKEGLSLTAYAIKPTRVKETPAVLNIAEAASFAKKEKLLGTLSNAQLKLSFEEVINDKTGKRQLVATTAIFQDQGWATLKAQVEENRVFLLSTKKAKIEFGAYFASWKNTASLTEFVVKGKTYNPMDQNGAKNPFLAGELSACQPSAVKQVSPEVLWVTYLTDKGEEVKGIWTLKPGASHYELSLEYSAKEEGFYSFVVAAFQDVSEQEVQQVQLPPMFNYKRLPTDPILIPGAMTPQPLAIVELGRDKPLSFFVTGSLTDFPLDWGKDNTSRIGFSLKNAFNQIQPVAFAPVLGLEDSKLRAGQSLKRTFNLGAVAENWNGALEYISNSIYEVKDYRAQDSSSLTNAAFNMIDLVKNDDASGWNAQLKGFYDIEADPKIAPTVAQSAPLALISAAIMGRDEELYLSRALPTIEYTLSRSAFRWAKAVGAPYNLKEASLVLDPYKNVQFNTAYFDALNQLLEEKNPWLVQVGMPDQQPRKLSGYSVNLPAWTQELAAYRLTKDKQWLDKAVLHAREFLQKEVYGQKTEVLTAQPFYNTSFYPYWWDLMDLYEVNKDKVFLDAAKYASFFTIAGIRSYPLVQNQKQRIHEGGRYEGNTNLWWKDGKKFRLGFPRIDGDVTEKEVPQSLISPVGLGLEQPVTFFLPNKNVRHIFMSTWAPHLLRLSAESNKDIFEIYARNSIIGRFSNYPGYYATGFTDLTYQANYPYKGPDINSIYYHHISPHLAFTLDFLVTEAIQRSKGKITFPWGKQEGFVWFNNRIYGAGKGTIFDDSRVKLWLKKGLVHIGNPAINYITGISDDRFWLVLLNEAQQEQQFEIGLDPDQLAVKNTGIKFYEGITAKPKEMVLSGKTMKSVIAGKGLTAYSFPLQQPVAETVLLPVKNGMQEINIGTPWGKLHAFRIRSPFGWDSIYAYLSTPPLAGAAAEMVLNEDSATVVKCVGYPFEWSFPGIDPVKPASISLKLKKEGSTEVQQVDVVFEVDKK